MLHQFSRAVFPKAREIVLSHQGLVTKQFIRNSNIPHNLYMLPLNQRFFSDQTNNNNNPEVKEAEKVPDVGTTTEQTEVETLQKEVKQLKDQLLRAYAEGENTRRIAARDVENARSYANSSFAKSLLEIADDLERALATVPADKRKTGDKVLDNLIMGIEMTDKNMMKVFQKFGVVKYGEPEEKFDPNFHEALYRVPDATKPANTIAAVVKKGYKIKDRVLRPAEVGVRVSPDA